MTRTEQAPGILMLHPHRYNIYSAAFLMGGVNKLVRTMAATTGARLGDHVLDIGSGPGKLARAMADIVGPEGAVLGIDPSSPMVDYANNHSRRQANCRFELGAAQSLTVAEGSFDVVTSTYAMHHIPEEHRQTALAGMYRALRPGGRLLLADMFPTRLAHRLLFQGMTRIVAHRNHGHAAVDPADPLGTIDIRRYRNVLREIGFDGFEYRVAEPSTGVLTARK